MVPDAALPLLRSRRQRMLYRAGLRRADAVIAQTDTQRELIQTTVAKSAEALRLLRVARGADFGGELEVHGTPKSA